MNNKTHTAKNTLQKISKQYPAAWKHAEYFRSIRDELGGWDDWCYLPLGGWYSIVANSTGEVAQIQSVEKLADISKLAALGAWRMTQGIYRFDPEIYHALINTSTSNKLPSDLLFRLPEWCVYIETPGIMWSDAELRGAWAHLEHDANNKRKELRLLSDSELGNLPMVLHLGEHSLYDALTQSIATSNQNLRDAQSYGVATSKIGSVNFSEQQIKKLVDETINPIISLLLYLCTESPDITNKGQPGAPSNPKPKKVKKGWRTFATNQATTWDVGVRVGAAIKQAATMSDHSDGETTGRTVRPHIRRAHWHTYFTGKRKREDGSDIPASQRRRELKWIPPLPIAVTSLDELPAVIRTVKGEGG